MEALYPTVVLTVLSDVLFFPGTRHLQEVQRAVLLERFVARARELLGPERYSRATAGIANIVIEGN